jgi:hypothetical protein
MADNLVFEESLASETETSEFTNKKWVYVNDSNAQNYQSQITIDTTPLSNAGGWVNWSEAFMIMPLVVQLTSTNPARLPLDLATGVLPTAGNFAWGFKSGFWQMIHSMTVEFNNQNIVQQTPFLNVFRSFKANTSFSQDDLKNEGCSLGFYPDTADSWSYCQAFCQVGGAGSELLNLPFQTRGLNNPYTNNTNAYSPVSYSAFNSDDATTANNYTSLPSLPQTNVAGTPTIADDGTLTYTGYPSALAAVPVVPNTAYQAFPVNQGFYERQKYNNYNPSIGGDQPITQANSVSNASFGQSIINPSSSCNTVYRSSLDLQQSQAGNYIWNVYAKLRLKDLEEFFEKCPLLKGSTMRFYINTNQSLTSFEIAASSVTPATGAPTYGFNEILSVNTVGGATNPLMVADSGFGQGCAPLGADTYNLSVSIATNQFQSQLTIGGNNYTAASSPLKSCRVYAPLYRFSAVAETRYLSTVPTKKIMYKDIIQFSIPNIAANTNFSKLVTNGLSNLCSVLVIPFISTSNSYISYVNGAAPPAVKNTLPFTSFANPCVATPAAPDPIMLTNFNIVISGMNLFLNNENYDFEAFRCQLLQSNQINGSLTTGLASGLVSEFDFTNLYRYYYGDCSRIPESEAGVPRSIQINAQNASQVTIDLMVFCEYMREITIDLSTGARID